MNERRVSGSPKIVLNVGLWVYSDASLDMEEGQLSSFAPQKQITRFRP